MPQLAQTTAQTTICTDKKMSTWKDAKKYKKELQKRKIFFNNVFKVHKIIIMLLVTNVLLFLMYQVIWTEKGDSESDKPPPPAHLPLDAVWQPVIGTKFRFYVYSAYVESRTVAAVRIIAATKTHGPDLVVCRLWLPDNRTLTLKATVKYLVTCGDKTYLRGLNLRSHSSLVNLLSKNRISIGYTTSGSGDGQAIREHWDLKYSATYVLCLLRDSGVKPQETVGASVSVVATAAVGNPATNLLTVLDTEPKKGIEETLHVCVKPFHSSYSRSDWLVEWFELNRLLGASHFYMYNESLSASVGCILDHYRQQGLITLLPWKLPIVSKVEIRTEGLFAAFNDCLYRSMQNVGWLLVIDVDEVILPRRDRSLPAMLTALRAIYKPPRKAPSAFLFRNAFFYLRWEDDTELKASLTTARKTRRWMTPYAFKNRSKYVVRPRDAVELGNHEIWELTPGANSAGLSPDLALLHHYRITCDNEMECLSAPSMVDRTALRWTNELVQRVNNEKQALATACLT